MSGTTRAVASESRRPRRLAAVGLAAASIAVAVAAPAVVGEARSWQGAREHPKVVIGVDSGSDEQVALGEVYRQMFFSMGRDAETRAVDTRHGVHAVDLLAEDGVDFTVACTGTLLTQLDRAAAEKLAGDMAAPAPGTAEPEGAKETYDAAVSALPGDVTTVDLSPAEGCADVAGDTGGSALELPRNLIPIFPKAEFTRDETQRINFINRALDTKGVADMARKVSGGEPATEAVRGWLREQARTEVRDSPDTTQIRG